MGVKKLKTAIREMINFIVRLFRILIHLRSNFVPSDLDMTIDNDDIRSEMIF